MRKVQSFSEINAETTHLAGGKGGVLADLYKRGYPVPDGFVVLTPAFNENGLLPDVWDQVKENLNRLKQSNAMAFAVRSSALSEDSSETSFAGEFETVLGVKSEEEIQEAIHTVWSSRKSERVQTYSEIHGLKGEHDIAVVVQSLVDSDYAGVLFTVDPLTGKPRMLGNYVHGLGEKLVSGEADALDFTFDKTDGVYEGPKEFEPVSSKLYNLALKLESDLGAPQDIEWAVYDGSLFLLQSRPITTLAVHDPLRGYYNQSLQGDYIWNSAGIGENLPGIMKPSTWSVWKIFFFEILEWEIKRHPAVGNIAGRPYVNLSVMFGVASKIYGIKRTKKLLEPSFGKIPDVTMAPLDISFRDILQIIPGEIGWQRKVKKMTKQIPEFIETNQGNCEAIISEIKKAESTYQLIRLWHDKVKPLFILNGYMLKTINEGYQGPWTFLAQDLTKLIGKEDADLLMSTMGNTSEELASLGVMQGVAKIANGELSREEYLKDYGHRFPDEWHLHSPRPSEDPSWLDEQVEKFKENPFNLETLSKRQREKYADAWTRFESSHPRKSRQVRKKLENFASMSVDREHIRSEITRSVCVVRELYLRAGEVTGLNDDIFLLTYSELLDILDGKDGVHQYITDRRETDRKLRALPELPAIISGSFNPFTWSRNPDRRIDYYDSHGEVYDEDDPGVIQGNPGSGGRMEGLVRVIHSLDEGHLLEDGEVLVTSTTNIGWTPIFPRASAVVTDIGMPLAHASIVARELGIPAVVGCGNATTRLKTGDRVLVDGDQGVVRLLDQP